MHPPNLQYQDMEGVSNWLNSEGKMSLFDDFCVKLFVSLNLI